jgi:FlaA1/EpsC-like NDP-sugar epimerase
MLGKALDGFAAPLLGLPRPVKRGLVLMVDASLCVLAAWLAFYLRLGEFVRLTGGSAWSQGAAWAGAASVALALPLFVVHGLYRAIFRYSGLPAMLAVARAMAIYGVLYGTLFLVVGVPGVPRTVGLIQPMVLLLLVGGSRLAARAWLGGQYRDFLRRAALPKAVIYGAGQTGRQLAAALARSHELRVLGFVDDDTRLHGHLLDGLRIYGPGDLPDLVRREAIHSVLLAMPAITRQRRREILDFLQPLSVAVRTLPSVADLAHGRVTVSDLREPDLDDLLGREPVPPNPLLLARHVTGRVVLVTGAGGSIGSELCRQVLALRPARLLLVDHAEQALYAVHHELEARGAEHGVQPVPLLASVLDAPRLAQIFDTYRPDTVYHAAAYKHVPLVEHNPVAGVRNNVFGTLYVAQVALAAGTANFVLVSTDKAVRPSNVMGASKRLAELVLQALAAREPATRFCMVRFGNVLGSSGSVVPKFRAQIRDGGPVTLTHPEVTRYFMAIPEAAQLVIQAGALGRGGDVFVLDMGEPVRIADLARRMVELSGLVVRDDEHPDGDIEIVVSGLRPGEKLYEELLIGNDPQPTAHPRILMARDEFVPWPRLEGELERLQAALAANDLPGLRAQLQRLVAGYQPAGEIVDWLHLGIR